jgi:DNA-binding transcriptional LysR family regulator
MHIRYIESFLTLFEEGNISKASKKLFISQQGLSKQILTLEKELGAKLFERHKNGVIPTLICKKLYPHFLSMQESYSSTKDIIRKHTSDEKGIVTIAFASGISQGLNKDVILNFKKDFPHVNFQIKEWPKRKCIEMLKRNDADLALLVNPFDMSEFDVSELTEGYMYVAIHTDHPLSIHDEIDFKELHEETLITGLEDNCLRELFDYYCELEKIKPNITFSSSYTLDMINTNTDADIIATVTPVMVDKITNPNIKIIKLVTPKPGKLYCCTLKTKKQSKHALTVKKYIEDYFAQIDVISI